MRRVRHVPVRGVFLCATHDGGVAIEGYDYSDLCDIRWRGDGDGPCALRVAYRREVQK